MYRAFSRFQSLFFFVALLSCCFLPLAIANSIFALPFLKYIFVGTIVNPSLCILPISLLISFLLSKSLLPALSGSTLPRIIFTSSGVAKKGKAFWGAYAVSKAGVVGLTLHLASYWAKNKVRVNTLSPGGIFSGQNKKFVNKN